MVEIASVIHDAFQKRPRPFSGHLINTTDDLDRTDCFYITIGSKKYIFEANRTYLDHPYKVQAVTSKLDMYRKIRCVDAFQAAVNLPKTLNYHHGFIEDDVGDGLNRGFSNPADIVADIEEEFGFPVFIKPAKGSMGEHCFYVDDEEKLLEAVTVISSQRKPNYRDIIAQQALNIKREYRAVYFDGEIYSVFDRMFNERGIVFGDGNPITSEYLGYSVTTQFLEDPKMLAHVRDATHIIAKQTGLIYFGADFAEDNDGNIWFVEVNSTPMLHLMYSGRGDNDMDRLANDILDYIEHDALG